MSLSKSFASQLTSSVAILVFPGLVLAAGTSASLASGQAADPNTASGPIISKPVVSSGPVVNAPSKTKSVEKPAAGKSVPVKKAVPVAALAKPVKKAAPAKAPDAEMKAQMDKLVSMMTGMEAKLTSIEAKMDGAPPEVDAEKSAERLAAGPVTGAAPAASIPSSDQNFLASEGGDQIVDTPSLPGTVSHSTSAPAQALTPAPVARAATAPVAAPVAGQGAAPQILEGRHRSFDNGFWSFDASGYTLRCQTACPALMMLDDSKPLKVNAANGQIEFQTQVGPRTCQVQRCEAVR